MDSTARKTKLKEAWVRQGWKFWYLAITVAAALFFTCAPAILQKNINLPPAYELKSERPLADTAQLTIPRHEGERSHGAKLTPRIAGASLLYLATQFKLHPYLPATVFGIIFLFSGIQIGFYISKDRLIALFFGLTFAGLYATSACFSLGGAPKPFDGIALGFLGLTLITYNRNSLLFGVLAFLSCWADERALVSLFCIGIFSYCSTANSARIFNRKILTLASAIIYYGLSRFLLSNALHWAAPNTQDMGIQPGISAQFFPLAAWTCFEGAWLIIVLGAVTLFLIKKFFMSALLIISTLAVILSCVVVLDISRASSFSFPLIAAAFSVLVVHKMWTLRELRIVAGSAALISLLAPNFVIIMKYNVISWLPALPYYLLHI